MELTYLAQLVAGDWSSDGHGLTETKLIKSNYSIDDIHRAAFKVIEERMPSLLEYYGKPQFRSDWFMITLCQGYEDYKIDIEILELLGVNPSKDVFKDDRTYGIHEGYDVTDEGSWFDLIFHIAKNELSDLEWAGFQMDSLAIGGYGLFSM